MRQLARVLAVAIFAGWALPAVAQTALTVSVNGTSYATGTYTANMFLDTCNGDQTTSSISGDPAQLEMQWSVPTTVAAVTIFGDTSNDCNTGLATTNPDSGIAVDTSDGTITTITTNPCTGSTSCGPGVGNVTIDLRSVMSTAFTSLFPGIGFDGGDDGPCYPNELAPAFYVCITETVNEQSTLSSSQNTVFWYMTVNFDTQPPPAPSDVTGAVGDENITVDWTYTSATLPADHYLVYYQADPTPGIVADVNGNCAAPAASGMSGRELLKGRELFFDGGCDEDGFCCGDVDVFGDCCGDAGVEDDGGCGVIVDAGLQENITGVCNGCGALTDCQQPALCAVDSDLNTYCAPACNAADTLPDGGSLDCPAGFNCQEVTDVGGIQSGSACVPADGLCRPTPSLCGSCASSTDCAGIDPNAICTAPSDGGGTYCAVPCSNGTDGGVNANDAGVCLGDTQCATVAILNSSFTGQACAPPTGNCYDPTPLAVVFDGGDTFVNLDAGSADAGLGGCGIIPTTWQSANIPSANSTAQITGLSNGVCYDFVVQAVLSDGTQGATSCQVTLAPTENFDFWRLYQIDCAADGGTNCDQGGFHCQSGGGMVGVLAVMAAFLALARRRRVGRSE